MQPLRADLDVAFDISRSVSNEAVELHDELVGLQRDWDNVARAVTAGEYADQDAQSASLISPVPHQS